jgi:hypothetical protein
MQQFSSLLFWRLFTAQHVLGVFPPIIRSSITSVTASGFTFVSWWQSCCVKKLFSIPFGKREPKLILPSISRTAYNLLSLKYYCFSCRCAFPVQDLVLISLYCYEHLNYTELSHTCLSSSSANVAILFLFSPLTRLISLRKYVVESNVSSTGIISYVQVTWQAKGGPCIPWRFLSIYKRIPSTPLLIGRAFTPSKQ